MSFCYHIRRPLRRARGNQFYRDKSNRGQGTYCAAPETAYDVAARDKAPVWQHSEHGEMFPCATCVSEREKQP